MGSRDCAHRVDAQVALEKGGVAVDEARVEVLAKAGAAHGGHAPLDDLSQPLLLVVLGQLQRTGRAMRQRVAISGML